MAVTMAAFASQASYLFWQVNLADEGLTKVSEGNYTFNNNAVTGFRVAGVSGAEDTYTAYTWGGSTAADSVGRLKTGTGYASYGGYATAANASGNTYLVADVTTISASTYTYYVEILGAGSSVIGVGTTGLTYADAVTQGRLVNSLSDIGASPLEAWTGGAYAAPEPTSGLLLLVGGALLALRRRRA